MSGLEQIQEVEQEQGQQEVVGPIRTKLKNTEKCTRYYYRHREELKEKRLQKLMENPEYVAKQEAKRQAKEEKERRQAEREAAKQEKAEREALAKAEREERRRQKAARVGLAI